MSSLKEEILALCKEQTKLKPIHIKEWDKTVYVKPLTARQVMAIQENKSHAYAIRLVAACACDEEGNTLFSPAEVCDLTEDGFVALFLACEKSSALGDDAITEAKKNSTTTPSLTSAAESL